MICDMVLRDRELDIIEEKASINAGRTNGLSYI